ncbi:hypothetical protein M9H77_08599 [Catharanthus roseus]|uniref:Uncharacterized protein n=1 Tax=Catharanthus roseus TaxID=4058 RepID=A0ACC0BYE8_CATRO|nr:hypothetical protein M9H77_08599 [Catharanthus roseus]
MIRNFSYASEEFIHYFLSATLAGGMLSRSRLDTSVQVGSPTPSFPVVLLSSSGKSMRRLRENLLSSSDISDFACLFIEGDLDKGLKEGADLTVASSWSSAPISLLEHDRVIAPTADPSQSKTNVVSASLLIPPPSILGLSFSETVLACCDPPIFRPDWEICITNRIMHPSMALEMLEKLSFSRDTIFASQYGFQDLKNILLVPSCRYFPIEKTTRRNENGKKQSENDENEANIKHEKDLPPESENDENEADIKHEKDLPPEVGQPTVSGRFWSHKPSMERTLSVTVGYPYHRL